MVKRRKNNTKKKRNGKGFNENGAEARKINASTEFETCTEQLSQLDGLLSLIKFLDKARSKIRPWEEDNNWPQRFSLPSC